MFSTDRLQQVEVQARRSSQTTFLYGVKIYYTCDVVLALVEKLGDLRKYLQPWSDCVVETWRVDGIDRLV
jgi:hypothetical protein